MALGTSRGFAGDRQPSTFDRLTGSIYEYATRSVVGGEPPAVVTAKSEQRPVLVDQINTVPEAIPLPLLFRRGGQD